MRIDRNANLERELLADPGLRRHVKDRAGDLARRAEGFAHRIMPRNARAMEVRTDGDKVLVVNTDHGGHIDEFGSKNNPPNASLRRAARESGLRIEP